MLRISIISSLVYDTERSDSEQLILESGHRGRKECEIFLQKKRFESKGLKQ